MEIKNKFIKTSFMVVTFANSLSQGFGFSLVECEKVLMDICRQPNRQQIFNDIIKENQLNKVITDYYSLIPNITPLIFWFKNLNRAQKQKVKSYLNNLDNLFTDNFRFRSFNPLSLNFLKNLLTPSTKEGNSVSVIEDVVYQFDELSKKNFRDIYNFLKQGSLDDAQKLCKKNGVDGSSIQKFFVSLKNLKNCNLEDAFQVVDLLKNEESYSVEKIHSLLNGGRITEMRWIDVFKCLSDLQAQAEEWPENAQVAIRAFESGDFDGYECPFIKFLKYLNTIDRERVNGIITIMKPILLEGGMKNERMSQFFLKLGDYVTLF